MRRTERTHDGLDAPDGLLRLGDVERRSLLVAWVGRLDGNDGGTGGARFDLLGRPGGLERVRLARRPLVQEGCLQRVVVLVLAIGPQGCSDGPEVVLGALYQPPPLPFVLVPVRHLVDLGGHLGAQRVLVARVLEEERAVVEEDAVRAVRRAACEECNDIAREHVLEERGELPQGQEDQTLREDGPYERRLLVSALPVARVQGLPRCVLLLVERVVRLLVGELAAPVAERAAAMVRERGEARALVDGRHALGR